MDSDSLTRQQIVERALNEILADDTGLTLTVAMEVGQELLLSELRLVAEAVVQRAQELGDKLTAGNVDTLRVRYAQVLAKQVAQGQEEASVAVGAIEKINSRVDRVRLYLLVASKAKVRGEQ